MNDILSQTRSKITEIFGQATDGLLGAQLTPGEWRAYSDYRRNCVRKNIAAISLKVWLKQNEIDGPKDAS